MQIKGQQLQPVKRLPKWRIKGTIQQDFNLLTYVVKAGSKIAQCYQRYILKPVKRCKSKANNPSPEWTTAVQRSVLMIWAKVRSF